MTDLIDWMGASRTSINVPVGNLISVPFQNNTNFSVGPEERRENILTIQPVIAISINDNWGAGVSGVILHLEKGSPWGAMGCWSTMSGHCPMKNRETPTATA